MESEKPKTLHYKRSRFATQLPVDGAIQARRNNQSETAQHKTSGASVVAPWALTALISSGLRSACVVCSWARTAARFSCTARRLAMPMPWLRSSRKALALSADCDQQTIHRAVAAGYSAGISLGKAIGGTKALSVRRRRSGRTQRVPVIPIERDGARYLVSPRGETDWYCAVMRHWSVADEQHLMARAGT